MLLPLLWGWLALWSLPVTKPYKSTLKSASLHHHITNPKPGPDGFRQQTLLILWTCQQQQMKHHHWSLFFFNPPARVISCAAVGTHKKSEFVSFQSSWDLTVRHYWSTKLLLRSRIGFNKNVTLFCWADGCYWSSRCHLSGQTAATKLASVSTTWCLISSDVMQKQEQSKEWSCCRVHEWLTMDDWPRKCWVAAPSY